jgi:hypothetical protein
MNITRHLNLIITSFIVICLLIKTANAQTLPNIQTSGLRAPANIKIDGKITEWDGKLQAHNHATDVYYTIANDDDNLYLALQSSDQDALTKITNKGIVFNISTSGKKSDKNLIAITYPFFDRSNKPYINFKNAPKIEPGSAVSVAKADSFMIESNKRLETAAKNIKVSGVAGIDSIQSIYNDEGIKAKARFNNTMLYTYELAIPLKYLNRVVKKFAYQIQLPGTNTSDFVSIERNSDGVPTRIVALNNAVIPSKSHLAAVTATTDFWGEYTLANKP